MASSTIVYLDLLCYNKGTNYFVIFEHNTKEIRQEKSVITTMIYSPLTIICCRLPLLLLKLSLLSIFL